MNSLQLHEEAIRSQVCVECIYPTGSGICGTGQARECPLNTLLPKAIDAVRKGHSQTILDYLQSLRNGSKDQSAESQISEKEALWLVGALPLITVAVEEANRKTVLEKARSKKSGM